MPTRVALKHYGLDPDADVTLIKTGSVPNVQAAVQSGQVQGGLAQVPEQNRRIFRQAHRSVTRQNLVEFHDQPPHDPVSARVFPKVHLHPLNDLPAQPLPFGAPGEEAGLRSTIGVGRSLRVQRMKSCSSLQQEQASTDHAFRDRLLRGRVVLEYSQGGLQRSLKMVALISSKVTAPDWIWRPSGCMPALR